MEDHLQNQNPIPHVLLHEQVPFSLSLSFLIFLFKFLLLCVVFTNIVLPGDRHPKNYPGSEPEVLVWDSHSFSLLLNQSFDQLINFREAAAGPLYKDGTDLFSERPDPNALKVGNLLSYFLPFDYLYNPLRHSFSFSG